MKKLLVISAATFCFSSAIYAQSAEMTLNNDVVMPNPNEALTKKEIKEERLGTRKLEKKEISERSTQQFYEDFGNLPIVSTERTSDFDKITFIKDGTAQTAYYDVSFSLVGTITDKTVEDLPKEAQNYINRHYNNYSVKAVRYFDDNEENNSNINIYDQVSEDGNSYFVELQSDRNTVILRVTPNGAVYFFKELK